MNIEEYNERLKILLEQEVISSKSNVVALLAFKELLKVLNKTEIDQAEMLFTHLPLALTRTLKGENVEGPAVEIVNDIESSCYFSIAKEQVELLEERWGTPLPEGEKMYLYMHYTTVLSLNI